MSLTNEVHFASLYQSAVYWVVKGFEVFPIKQFGNTPASDVNRSPIETAIRVRNEIRMMMFEAIPNE